MEEENDGNIHYIAVEQDEYEDADMEAEDASRESSAEGDEEIYIQDAPEGYMNDSPEGQEESEQESPEGQEEYSHDMPEGQENSGENSECQGDDSPEGQEQYQQYEDDSPEGEQYVITGEGRYCDDSVEGQEYVQEDVESAPEGQEDSGDAPEGQEDSRDAPEGQEDSGDAPEGQEDSTDAPEGQEYSRDGREEYSQGATEDQEEYVQDMSESNDETSQDVSEGFVQEIPAGHTIYMQRQSGFMQTAPNSHTAAYIQEIPDNNEDSEGAYMEESSMHSGDNTVDEEVEIPPVLEQLLAFKDQREEGARESEEFEEARQTDVYEENSSSQTSMRRYAEEDEEEDDDEEVRQAVLQQQKMQGVQETVKKERGSKLSKNKKKKNRKKSKKALKSANGDDVEMTKDENHETGETDVEVEYVQESLGLHELAPQYRQFYHIFEAFKIADRKQDIPPPMLAMPTMLSTKTPILALGDQFQDEGEDGEEKKGEDKSKLSKRKLKKLTRLSVAELKQLVNRPDVVEMHDVTARDPKLLVQLKAHRNTVQVPRHWCFKRKYLQGKRGIEKPPFNLPDFIKRTGIMEMRASLQDKDESKTLKAKMRERARPKMGKIDIDYQKLHDAFFKWQTKPKMTIHGDLYYEGKEFETRLKEKKPGDLSEELRTALGMPVGPSATKVPPPWLIAMQRYGPPPSYPNLKIPGLNAPIPDGCSFGYHAGGWGKPPVDENGKPLYGDVFGTTTMNLDDLGDDIAVERTLWGELESESEEESEEEEEQEEEKEMDESGLITPAEGLVTPSGLTSIPAGMETPETIELRKKKIEAEMEGTETPVLYHVLPEKRNERIGGSMMASSHVYDMTGVGAPPPAVLAARRGAGTAAPEREGTVELALDPSELDMDSDAMAVRYEQQMRENQSQLQKEDLSDMLAEHVAKQKSKRKRQQNADTKQTKKYKEFKF